jgi:hypothetical protein
VGASLSDLHEFGNPIKQGLLSQNPSPFSSPITIQSSRFVPCIPLVLYQEIIQGMMKRIRKEEIGKH